MGGEIRFACPVASRCGGCQMAHLPYAEQLRRKQAWVRELLSPFCPVEDIVGMENPFHYRNKTHAVLAGDRSGNVISGVYRMGTHQVVPVDKCLIQNEKADAIIATVRRLLREFKIDIRGLDNIAGGIKISEIMAMVKMEILNMKRWDVLDEVYLANFSFARYAMWNDVRKNIDKFRKNAIVRSLLENRLDLGNTVFEDKAEDDYLPSEILSPLTADGSQFAAVAEAVAGTTFVLHGPPGTGKSQTITNIIANCLNRGKRVLFVAEKQAALSVVKKRLDSIGLGDFCLELHSNKTDKSQLLKKLETTLSLAAEQDSPDFVSKSEQIDEVRRALNEPIAALHKPRRLGVSVYEGILIYLKNKNAPDVLDIESTFYDSLTKEKLENYENMLVEVSAAAKQCGGVHRSPFDNVNLSEYSPGLRSRAA